ncbi:MAG: hypothetical protein ACHQ7M_12770 [Chloroflexota bacterium]
MPQIFDNIAAPRLTALQQTLALAVRLTRRMAEEYGLQGRAHPPGGVHSTGDAPASPGR